MTKFADLEKLRKPATITVRLQLDGEAQQRIDQLRRQVAAARQAQATGEAPTVPEMPGSASLADPVPLSELQLAEAALAEAIAAAEDTAVEFTLQAASYVAVEALKNSNPPTDDQRAQGLLWNPDELGPRLLALCLADPEITVEEAQQLWNEWQPGLVNTLYKAAWDVCHSAPVVRPLSQSVSAKTPTTEQS